MGSDVGKSHIKETNSQLENLCFFLKRAPGTEVFCPGTESPTANLDQL